MNRTLGIIIATGGVLAGMALQASMSRQSAGPDGGPGREPAVTRAPETFRPDHPAGGARSTVPGLSDFLRALAAVESGGDDAAIGDGGASRGRYQIGLSYWRDAWRLDREPVTEAMRAEYRVEAADPARAEATMLRYWQRYCPAALAAGDWGILAAVHNGGPSITRLRRANPADLTETEARRLRNATAHAAKVLRAMQ